MRSHPTLALLVVFLAVVPQAAAAHPLAPSLLRIVLDESGAATMTWRAPAVRPRGQRLHAIAPAGCRATGQPRRWVDGDAAVEETPLQCDPDRFAGQSLTAGGIRESRSTVIVSIHWPDESVTRALLSAQVPSVVIAPAQAQDSTFASYLRMGFEHLVTGVDHVLFVLGLLLLIGWSRKLLAAITAFTLGHSATLVLCVLGVVAPPSLWVEVGIAATIVLLALEIERKSQAATHRRPWLWPFAFGLLHGMGFAGALREVALEAEAIPMALFSFNVGIELGQLAIVVLILGLFLATRRWVVPLQTRAAQLTMFALGTAGAYWLVERLWTVLRLDLA